MDFQTPTCGWVVGDNGVILKTSDEPTMLIPKLSAYQGKLFSFNYTPYSAPSNYSFQLPYPKGMSVSSDGIVSWTPQADSVYQQLVNLIATDIQGHSDSIAFSIDVNPDKKPFTKIFKNNVVKANGSHAIEFTHVGKTGMEISFHGIARFAEILDLKGRVLLTAIPLSSTSGISSFRFDLPSQGCHVVRIVTGQENIIKKLP